MPVDLLISPEVLVPRLGDQLVEMGLLSYEQLIQVLEYQNRCSEQGRQLLLGQAIMELGYLDRATLDRAVTGQIQRFRTALEDANQHLELRVQQRTLELQEALLRLSENEKLKANIVANISHELRTPLLHILGYVDLLFNEALGPLTGEQRNALEVSLQAARHLQALIDNLILFSQSSRGAMTLSLKEVDLQTAISPLLERLKQRVADHNLLLDVKIDASLPIVNVDEEKILWVINQLLDNAIKFNQPGGKVFLYIIKNSSATNEVTVSVADTGIGIAPERIHEIFEPFHQLDGSTTRRYAGTGLGLTLVMQILAAHGSQINVKSEPGKGTLVTFPLQVAKAE